jgi:tRNA (guanine-N(7)-)-methyltransferase subunit TRM82
MMPDGSSILSADKFGDVYALPLLPTLEEDEAARQAAKTTPKAFTPSATELTVHSKANLRALESQLKQAKEIQAIKGRDTLSFAHELLLGHVSMLTDVAVTEVPTVNDSQKPRQYILTSDRDEHIRVSRGPPQAHIIEGFCLGHHEFVTKLCLLEPDLLVSGGGDGDLYVWDWLKGKIISKINIQSAVMEVVKRRKGEDSANASEKDLDLIVSGIWLFPGSSQEKVISNGRSRKAAISLTFLM